MIQDCNLFRCYTFLLMLASTCFVSAQLTWPEQSDFVTNGRDSVYVLTQYPIQRTSFVLRSDASFCTPPYGLNAVQGRIVFAAVPDSGLRFHATYHLIPLGLKQQYRRYVKTDSAGPDSVIKQTFVRPLSKSESVFLSDEGLRKSGSIFRGISVGSNQGMQLKSGLRLNVSGTIAPGIDVSASLTDQNTPIQPEGNTQTLQEIDKIYIQIKAPHVKTTLGDITVAESDGEFAAYARKLQGVTGSVQWKNGEVTLTAAATKGEYTSNFIQGQEGNQGPYQLSGSRGRRDMIVLAGTEKVWIDGDLMTRGEDQDYTIDYATGQLLFTRKCLITDDSRIRVDFEYSDEKYQKSVYGLSSRHLLLADKLNLKTTLLREFDDKNNPLDKTLDDEALKILALAGDSTDHAACSGARYAGPGEGAYNLREEDGLMYYEYKGVNEGEYYVTFSYLGSGQGDYSFQGYGIYRYEGPGKGDYAPIELLPLASGHQLADIEASYQILPQLQMGVETAVSDLDRNLFSSLHDKDNMGTACSGFMNLDQSLTLNRGKLDLGRIRVGSRFRKVDEDFRRIGLVGEVEQGRKWGQDESLNREENSGELTVMYQPHARLKFNTDLGLLKQNQDFNSQRQMYSGQWSGTRIPVLKFRSEQIESRTGQTGQENYWLRQSGDFKGRWFGLEPGAAYQGEHRKTRGDSLTDGFQYQEWTGGLAWKHKGLQGRVSRSMRTQKKYAVRQLVDDSQSMTDQMALSLKNQRGFTASGQWIHRTRDYADPGIEDKITDLADLKMGYTHPRRLVQSQTHYQFSSSQVSQMVTDTLKVGIGLGQYRYDEVMDELVPDPDGDLLIRRLQTGNFMPVYELETGFDIRLNGNALKQKKIKGLKTRTRFRIERKDRQRSFQQVNQRAFQPAWGKDSTLVYAMFSCLQDIEYHITDPGVTLRYRYQKNDSENHQLLHEGMLRRLHEHQLFLKGRWQRLWGYSVESLMRGEKRCYFSRPASDRDISLKQLQAELSYRPVQIVELSFQTRYRFARDKAPETPVDVTAWFFKSRLTYALRQRGQLRLEAEWGRVEAPSKTSVLPYEMLNGDQPGKTIRWSMHFTYRMSGHVTATLQYRGRREPWRESLYQTGQMEVRAFF